MKLVHRILALLGGAGILIALAVMLSFWSFRQIREAAQARTHTAGLINSASTFLSELNDAETGQRGFILTADAAFLRPYLALREDVNSDLDLLRKNTTLALARKHLEATAALVDATLADMAQVIEVRRSGDFIGAIAILSNGKGKLLMEAIRAEMNAYIDIEKVTLSHLEAQFESNMQSLFGLIFAVSLFALLLALAFAFLIYRQAKQKIRNLVHVETRHLLVRQQETNQQLQQAYAILQASEEKLGVTLNAMRDSTALTQAILNTVVDGIITFHSTGSLVETVNPAAGRMFGYAAAELVGQNLRMLIPELDQDQDQATLAYYSASEQARAIGLGREVMGRRKDGSLFPMEMAVSEMCLGGERHFAGLLRDITARTQAEASALRINAIAFESQESLIITDAQGVTLRVNQAFTDATGYASDEVVGQTPALLKSDRYDAHFYLAIQETVRCTGTWQGEIWNRRKNGDTYPVLLTISAVKGGDGVVTHYVGSQIDMTKRLAAEETIRNMAFYDPLTGLPNRRLLMDQLHHAIASSARSGRNGAVLFIDLDNFKDINDTLGHDVGDLLLQQTAHRLKSCMREGDIVARLGGDEFVVLLEDLSEHLIEAAMQTETVGEKFLATLGQPYHLASHEYHSTPSIGAAMFSDEAQSVEELLKRADIAMYQAKKAGRNTLRFFNPHMQEVINTRITLENELRKAIDCQQFRLHYQVQVDSANRVLGAEALIRWLHPGRDLVAPNQFIPLAEETGLILPIGQWVMETACKQLKAWQQDARTRHLVLSVNVSARQFRQPDFVKQAHALLQRHAVNPMLLKLEITETMLLENVEDTIAAMNALKEIGVQFSLDDFGTGYSSLQYLKRLPLDQIKIDQSFVRDLVSDSGDQAIVSTIIAMTQSLKMSVIAEGVETQGQRQHLLQQGCTHFQGYLFSKPVPIQQFEALLPPPSRDLALLPGGAAP